MGFVARILNPCFERLVIESVIFRGVLFGRKVSAL
jgi:hypothetical protein